MNTRLLFGLLWLTPLLCFGAPSTSTAYFYNVEALTNLTARSAVRGLTGVFTNSATAGINTATKAFQAYQGTLTHAGTVTLDFDATTTDNSLVLTGSVTFAFSNVATNRTYQLFVVNPQATNITLTFPSGVNTSTNWFGGKPGSMTAGTVAQWSLKARGSTDGDVKSAWSDAF